MGCENNFLAVCQGVKKRVFEEKIALFVFVFLYVGTSKKDNMKKVEYAEPKACPCLPA